MKTEPDHQAADRLIEAILGHEPWQTSNAAFKSRALGAYRARQRLRLVGRASLAAGVVLCVVCATLWSQRAGSRLHAGEQASVGHGQIEAARTLTDQELVSAFPPGSCFLAEVDGHWQLIFSDPAVEKEYIRR